MKNISEAKRRKASGDLIIGYQRAIDCLEAAINEQAKARYKEFHFLDHKISTFWRCDKSPVGMCIFERCGPDYKHLGDCVFCLQPAERK